MSMNAQMIVGYAVLWVVLMKALFVRARDPGRVPALRPASSSGASSAARSAPAAALEDLHRQA